ncbi:unnamed protein product [Tetraodon nigroviridis]|uniref:Chromosome undetermined SCAF14724, whole genome shotgun sequence n=1 Tax=Tetraodon nigroviridis TaxID=99883 RepID=Q4S6M9_TETNG|nr:unnamed protein product [Tetraodon nigroviridis]
MDNKDASLNLTDGEVKVQVTASPNPKRRLLTAFPHRAICTAF